MINDVQNAKELEKKVSDLNQKVSLLTSIMLNGGKIVSKLKHDEKMIESEKWLMEDEIKVVEKKIKI